MISLICLTTNGCTQGNVRLCYYDMLQITITWDHPLAELDQSVMVAHWSMVTRSQVAHGHHTQSYLTLAPDNRDDGEQILIFICP